MSTEERPVEEASDIGVEESDDEEEGVTLEYEEDDYNDAPMYYERAGRKRNIIDRLVDMTGRIFPDTSREARRNIIYSIMIMVPAVIVIIISSNDVSRNPRRCIATITAWLGFVYHKFPLTIYNYLHII